MPAALGWTLAIFAIVLVLAGIAVGFLYMEGYVQKTSPARIVSGPLKLLDRPEWFNTELMNKVESVLGGSRITLDEGAAEQVTKKLETIAWLYDVRAQTKKDCVEVTAGYRKPIAMVEKSSKKYYVDKDMVVLDYVPVSELSIVRVKGFAARKIPRVGTIWIDGDITAGVKLLKFFGGMDELSTPDAPLLNEIANINVSNYSGKKDSKKPHLVLYALDNTAIYWGAELGRAAAYLEAPEEEKMASLYGHYKEFGTVQGIKRIDLRPPQRSIPRPRE